MLGEILATVLVTVLIAEISTTSMVRSIVGNLQCNFLSQTKACGQKWQETM